MPSETRSDRKLTPDEAQEMLEQLIADGYVSPRHCVTHDSFRFTTEEENEDFEQGFDPCYPAVRLWFD